MVYLNGPKTYIAKKEDIDNHINNTSVHMTETERANLSTVLSNYTNVQKNKITADDGSPIYTISGETLPAVSGKGIFYAKADSVGTYGAPLNYIDGIIIAESSSYWNFIGFSDDGTCYTCTKKSSNFVAWTEIPNMSRIGVLSLLKTTAKTNLVSSINELFQFANDGKTSISSAINAMGGSTSSSSTFASLASAIRSLSTGAKMASGRMMAFNYKLTVSGLNFTPKYIITQIEGANSGKGYSVYADFSGVTGSSAVGGCLQLMETSGTYAYTGACSVSSTGFTIDIAGNGYNTTWVAFG